MQWLKQCHYGPQGWYTGETHKIILALTSLKLIQMSNKKVKVNLNRQWKKRSKNGVKRSKGTLVWTWPDKGFSNNFNGFIFSCNFFQDLLQKVPFREKNRFLAIVFKSGKFCWMHPWFTLRSGSNFCKSILLRKIPMQFQIWFAPLSPVQFHAFLPPFWYIH